MGGAKKKSPAQQEKSQTDDSTKKPDLKKKGKKKEKSAEGSTKAEITVIVNEEQAMKYIKSAKVITIQDLSRQTGVKISAANAFLKKLVKEGIVKRIGGYSGHHVYQPISA
jgi:small subunit ribosomal protein S25e